MPKKTAVRARVCMHTCVRAHTRRRRPSDCLRSEATAFGSSADEQRDHHQALARLPERSHRAAGEVLCACMCVCARAHARAGDRGECAAQGRKHTHAHTCASVTPKELFWWWQPAASQSTETTHTHTHTHTHTTHAHIHTCASVTTKGVVTGCAKSEHGNNAGTACRRSSSPPAGHAGPDDELNPAATSSCSPWVCMDACVSKETYVHDKRDLCT